MLREEADPRQAEILQRFFKTEKGEYGEGDKFLGIKVPVQRKIARQFIELPLEKIQKLLYSSIHEERLTALFILVYRYEKSGQQERDRIYSLYIKNTKNINNWDLVDSSADKILGRHIMTLDKKILFNLAGSKNLWERRISIISTFYFIKQNVFDITLEISKLLLKDNEDLIHKAVGWMLRETGKRDLNTELSFLNSYYQEMPRTMLRYAIEKLPEGLRQKYLKGEINPGK